MPLKNIFVYPRYPEKLRKLIYLSFNMWTLWDTEASRLFNRINPALFRSVNNNPVAFLHSIPEERLKDLASDKAFLYDLEKIWEKYEQYSQHQTARQDIYKDCSVAYFSMEHGLHQSIPNYAGGLGLLSGDHLKGASDLGMQITGVGLFYRYGYFSQRINLNGIQEEVYSANNVYYMPVRELNDPDGKPLYLTVPLLDTHVKAKVWYISVGRTRLLLLDTNLDENPPEFRRITDYLYDANKDIRFMQEMVLGLGGLKLLEAVKFAPDIFHLNEGHSSFLIIGRLATLINEEKCSFEEAYAVVKNSTVFTTHTPVEAGNENYPVEMVKKYLEREVKALGIGFDQFVKLGLLHDSSTFWLPAFAIRCARYVNGVSRIHSEVSRKMWEALFPKKMICEIPVIAITNGVHYSWLSGEMRYLFESYLGPDFLYEGTDGEVLDRIQEIPDEEIWEAHLKRKREMIAFLRKVVEANYANKGYSVLKIKKVQEMLNAGYLTIGFARRFVPYKRPNLVIMDKERLKSILTNPSHPIQLIFGGKAHPADLAGKNMIKEIMDFAGEYGLEDRVIFIENYDRGIALQMVQGADLWLNTPIKFHEASGTSGMKAGMNGVLNLSILDGWWPECYNGKNGWAITAGEAYSNPELRDTAESNQIYDLLEEEIAPLYYERDERDVPRQWVKMMKESISTVYKGFNINRMLADYSKKCYLPALQNTRRLLANGRKPLKSLSSQSARVREHWDKIFIKDVFTDQDKKELLFTGDSIHIVCYIYLDDADPALFDVEIFYFREKEQNFETVRLKFMEKYQDKTGKYEGELVLTSSGVQSINVRLVPANEDIRALYPELIKWRDS
jgi:starch phosphorylase